MQNNPWVSWRVLTEILIVDYFIKNNLSELESFTTDNIIKQYLNIIRGMRPKNLDVRATINVELHELIRTGNLIKTLRGIYKIAPESTLMRKLYAKRFEIEFYKRIKNAE